MRRRLLLVISLFLWDSVQSRSALPARTGPRSPWPRLLRRPCGGPWWRSWLPTRRLPCAPATPTNRRAETSNSRSGARRARRGSGRSWFPESVINHCSVAAENLAIEVLATAHGKKVVGLAKIHTYTGVLGPGEAAPFTNHVRQRPEPTSHPQRAAVQAAGRRYPGPARPRDGLHDDAGRQHRRELPAHQRRPGGGDVPEGYRPAQRPRLRRPLCGGSRQPREQTRARPIAVRAETSCSPGSVADRPTCTRGAKRRLVRRSRRAGRCAALR